MDIEVSDLKIGKSLATEEVYFSGGMKGKPTNLGWVLFPVPDDGKSALVFKEPKDHLEFATRECGLRFLGICAKYMAGSDSPIAEVWKFGGAEWRNGLGASDSWGAIKHQATKAGDARYAESAAYVSVSLRASGLRLRDVSNRYHAQLKWALAAKRAPGTWFSNLALQDLHLDFHSLLSELSSARDHAARVAAMHVGAPDRIDSLARLEDWSERSINRSHAENPMVKHLLSASGSKATPGWLRKMGDLRNEMLHRTPMAANRSVAGLILEQAPTSLGPVCKIRLAEPLGVTPLSQQAADPLTEISQFSESLETLCRRLAECAKYPAGLLLLGSRS